MKTIVSIPSAPAAPKPKFPALFRFPCGVIALATSEKGGIELSGPRVGHIHPDNAGVAWDHPASGCKRITTPVTITFDPTA